jgi:ADP-ribosylarginine hydrolase
MLLAATGDIIGYRDGRWEFNYNTANIHDEMMKLTDNKGIRALSIKNWMYSDDTVMHIATA